MRNMEQTIIKPVARIRTPFKEKFGIPRQSGFVDVQGEIVFEKEYRNPDALRGIENFSHLWLIFDFSLAHREEWSATVRPPRLGGNTKTGVFASRSPFRPNSLGLSCVKLVEVKTTPNEGTILVVSGADLLDGTPIYDIKPYLAFSDCHPNAVCGYADECSGHRLDVNFPARLCEKMDDCSRNNITECIRQDPRPSYHSDARTYNMRYGDYDVSFTVCENVATITDIRVVSE